MKPLKYILIVLLLAILVAQLGLVMADNVQSLGMIRTGDSIILKQNCVNVTYVNITSISMNGVIQTAELSSSIPMVLVSEGYQTYNFTNTSIKGQYIVTGICDENGVVKAWSYDFYVGTILGIAEILIYSLFLLISLVITYLSIKLVKNNKMSNDKISNEKLYGMKSRHEFSYYTILLKRKMWIIGIFGIYLSILLFIGLLTSLVYNMGLNDLSSVLNNLVIIMSWGLIPFILFWFGYIIIYFYTITADVLKYQLGSIGGRQ